MIQPLPDFEPAFAALNRYSTIAAPRLSQEERLLLREATHRLRDLELLSKRIHIRATQLLEAAAEAPVPGFSASAALELLRQAATTDARLAQWFAENPEPRVAGVSKALTLGHEQGETPLESSEEQEVRLDTELFYYVAHRFCICLALLPHLKNFQCKEIAIIRNQLLEHPEKTSSGVLLPAFGYRSDVGPVIKGMRYSHQVEIHPDAGFVPNCKALLDGAVAALDVASDHVTSGSS